MNEHSWLTFLPPLIGWLFSGASAFLSVRLSQQMAKIERKMAERDLANYKEYAANQEKLKEWAEAHFVSKTP